MSATRITFFRRLGSSLGLWAAIALAITLGYGWLYGLLIFAAALLALREFYGLLEIQGIKVFTLTGILCATVYLAGSFYFLSCRPGADANLEMGVLAAFLFVVFVRQMWRGVAVREPLESIAYTIFGLLYIPWLFNFVTKIIFIEPAGEGGGLPGVYYALFLLVATKFSDMGAYAFGSLFGKHKLVPHISPQKTWEGLGGAIFGSLLGGLSMYALCAERLPKLTWTTAVICIVVLSLVAVLGDLAESIIKRSVVAKDSSSVLPGIGGTMDLIDSLLFTAPVFYFFLRLVP